MDFLKSGLPSLFQQVDGCTSTVAVPYAIQLTVVLTTVRVDAIALGVLFLYRKHSVDTDLFPVTWLLLGRGPEKDKPRSSRDGREHSRV
ncbi:hypothetical protein O9K51_10659 [Purpureocillium lavendulum]|uniref:Uncharacterized protein n=1 Tax=Purpureocillium lavendulum TaxID=1247861 RepID=A0AB34FDV7_9HYPO|nr:hypothetical protein O9K51_10659 [Purpureocillium lavendulum]